MIQISDKAKVQILQLQEPNQASHEHYLHIAVKGGGCSGLLYEMNFIQSPNPDDHVHQIQGIQVAINKQSLLYLIGVTLDFSDGLNGKGFHFINPKATRTCGCGESFAL